jgi:hypothetical protein
MTVNMNNIVVEHHGVKISIAQHFHNDKEKPFVQEAMVLGGSNTIYQFDGTLMGLSGVLVAIEEDLNKEGNE